MRKELLDALKAIFTGVSENVLGRVADKLARTVTTAEQVTAAVEGVTFQQVLDSYGDSRATEAQQTAVRNYESKYGLKDGVKAEGGAATPPVQTPPPAGGEDVPSWAKAILDTNKALADRLNKFESNRTTATRREQLNGIIAKLPDNLHKAYERTPVENLTDEQFTALTGEISTEVDGIVTATQQKGAVFGRPTVIVGNKQENEQLTKEQVDVISHRDSIPKDANQPF